MPSATFFADPSRTTRFTSDPSFMSIAPFFALAMLSPNRQRSFRTAVCGHVLLTGIISAAVLRDAHLLPIAGQVLLIAGIVEGAVLIGWRLTQIPKSQALEFLLVSPIQPKRLLMAEAAVGFARTAFITLAGLPALGLLWTFGRIKPEDLFILIAMPSTWACFSGLAVTVWAYESRTARRVCEWIGLAGVLVYLVVGVLAGEHLQLWVSGLPESMRWWIMEVYGWLHTANPFAVMHYWFEPHRIADMAAERFFGLSLATVGCCGLLLMRGAYRLSGHFHDRHYRPLPEGVPDESDSPGDRPLAWWAVRRVMEYSGRVNIWLAGGFGALYAAYTVAGDNWPPWMGRLIFQMVESVGGIPALSAGLIVLAAVPACFQYGLWDSSVSDRCRRLELLLLTHLDGNDYWFASAAAAWRRGRGYFLVAGILWFAAWIAEKATIATVLASVVSGVLLWSLYFSLGFWSFARGRQANGLGMLLTLGVPLITVILVKNGWPELAALTPSGNVWSAMAVGPTSAWLFGALLGGSAALALWLALRGDPATASCGCGSIGITAASRQIKSFTDSIAVAVAAERCKRPATDSSCSPAAA